MPLKKNVNLRTRAYANELVRNGADENDLRKLIDPDQFEEKPKMGAAEDIINEKLKSDKPVSAAESMRTGEGLNSPKPPAKPVPLPEPNMPGKKPVPAKSWVQELKEHVQSMFRRKKKVESDPNNLNNTESRY